MQWVNYRERKPKRGHRWYNGKINGCPVCFLYQYGRLYKDRGVILNLSTEDVVLWLDESDEQINVNYQLPTFIESYNKVFHFYNKPNVLHKFICKNTPLENNAEIEFRNDLLSLIEFVCQDYMKDEK